MKSFLALFALCSPVLAQYSAHPSIWLTNQMISDMQAKRIAGDSAWDSVQIAANAYAAKPLPAVTVTAASNTNPVTFTTAATLPFTGTAPCYFGGATGSWAPINSPHTNQARSCVFVDGTHFSLTGLDSTSWGPFAGQAVTVFIADNVLSTYMPY